MLVNIVGWTFLISGWIVPRLIKNNQKRHLIGAVLSAISCGIFIGALLSSI
jgi:uncharacterized membrane protein YczE